MSRRYTSRSTSHSYERDDYQEQSRGLPWWYATPMPEPWDYYLWHQWPHAWGEYTIQTASTVWRNVGAKIYAAQRDHDLRDDLQDWLIVTAVESGANFIPDPRHPRPELNYSAWLYRILAYRARHHFGTTVSAASSPLKLEATNKARRRFAPSIEAQAEAQVATGVTHNLQPIWTQPFGMDDPVATLIRLEDLNERVTEIEREDRRSGLFSTSTTASQTCLVNLCSRPVHARGFCNSHYRTERKHAKERGDWQPYTPPEECSEEGCPSPPKYGGRCYRHYRAHRLANTPPCEVEGCESGSTARGLCGTHYQRWRKARDAGEGEAYL